MNDHPITTGEWGLAPRDPKLPGEDLDTIIDGESGRVELSDGETSIEGLGLDLSRTV